MLIMREHRESELLHNELLDLADRKFYSISLSTDLQSYEDQIVPLSSNRNQRKYKKVPRIKRNARTDDTNLNLLLLL